MPSKCWFCTKIHVHFTLNLTYNAPFHIFHLRSVLWQGCIVLVVWLCVFLNRNVCLQGYQFPGSVLSDWEVWGDHSPALQPVWALGVQSAMYRPR